MNWAHSVLSGLILSLLKFLICSRCYGIAILEFVFNHHIRRWIQSSKSFDGVSNGDHPFINQKIFQNLVQWLESPMSKVKVDTDVSGYHGLLSLEAFAYLLSQAPSVNHLQAIDDLLNGFAKRHSEVIFTPVSFSPIDRRKMHNCYCLSFVKPLQA